MKEMELIFKVVADGLKAMAQGLNSISEKISEIAKEQSKEDKSDDIPSSVSPKTKGNPKATKKTGPKKTTKKSAQRKKPTGKRPGTASDAVFQIIKNSETGIGNAALAEKTGYDKKKVSNILHRLKKQGKITSVDKGVYKIA